MFRWTTHQIDLKAAHLQLAQEKQDLEASFRRHVAQAGDFAETTGYDSAGEGTEEFYIETLRADLEDEMASINRTLSSPLAAEDLNLRNLVKALAAERQEALKAVSLSRGQMEEVEKQHEYEIKDLNLQALIHINKIDRLEQRVFELEQEE
jgi:hypothetical protein